MTNSGDLETLRALSEKATPGPWCSCDPPCAFQRRDTREAARKRMTKAQLLADATAMEDALMEETEERGMAEGWYRHLEQHLREHGCEHHDFGLSA